MGANEELFGLEQSRGWIKILERLKVEHEKSRGSQDSATEQGDITTAARMLGWCQAINWMSQLPRQLGKSLSKEKQ